MSDKKQSSVEWLISQLDKYYVLSFDDLKNNEAVEQAKAMHKKEITDSYDDGYSDSDNGNIINKQYYNETYGGNNE